MELLAQCENRTFVTNFDIIIDAFENVTRESCNVINDDLCVYQVNSQDDLIYCDVFIKDETNIHKSGNKSVTWILYILLRILFSYSLSPAWNFVDVIATGVASAIHVDWAVLSFFGSISAAVSPLVVGKQF